MKRSWLIGAALVFSLSAVACGDDDDDDGNVVDAGGKTDAGPITSIDSGTDAAKPDAGDGG